jgi:hypothetical protein
VFSFAVNIEKNIYVGEPQDILVKNNCFVVFVEQDIFK